MKWALIILFLSLSFDRKGDFICLETGKKKDGISTF